MKIRAIWLLLGCAVFWSGCAGDGTTLGPDGLPEGEGEGNGGPVTVATLAELSTDILIPRCATAGCHDAGSGSAGLVLSGEIAGRIIDVASTQRPQLKLVEPGNAADSYLLRKVENRDITNNQMPLDGTTLSAEEIEQIRLWIEAGAPLE